MKFPYQHELARYYAMPKEFVSPEQADELFTIYEKLSGNEKAFGYMFAAGSAAAESALMAHNAPADERHHRLEAARYAWQKAQDAFIFSHLHDGWSEARMMCVPDKVQVHILYLDIFHEMVDGFVEESTLGRLHASLVRFATLNKDLHDYSTAIGDWTTATARRGIGYEVSTLTPVTRLGCPSLFAIPSTARGDHGGFHSEKTHDVRLIQQSHGVINWWVPFEVKPTETQMDQYASAYVRGRVELLMPSSLQPLEIADYMQAELDGTITREHLKELDDITSRVLNLARDFRAREEFEQKYLQTAS